MRGRKSTRNQNHAVRTLKKIGIRGAGYSIFVVLTLTHNYIVREMAGSRCSIIAGWTLVLPRDIAASGITYTFYLISSTYTYQINRSGGDSSKRGQSSEFDRSY